MQSVAVKYGVNLFAFGFEAPGVVCAELERFAPNVSAELDSAVSGDVEKMSDAQELAASTLQSSLLTVWDQRLGGGSPKEACLPASDQTEGGKVHFLVCTDQAQTVGNDCCPMHFGRGFDR